MPHGHSLQTSPEDMQEILARLRPYLPTYLKGVDTQGHWLRFEFAPFTGREEEPSCPATYEDPKLSYVGEEDDAAEHLVREKARVVLYDLYDKARAKWADAAYVADLKTVVKDADARWKTYQHESKALDAAYDYLRSPEAAAEWPSALSRLVDAQERTRAAAVAFDTRAAEIAEVHERHLYADLGHDAALAAAGYPQAKDWHIVGADDYSKGYFSEWDSGVPLEEQARRRTEQQDAHIAKVGQLSGTTTGN